MLGKNSSRIFPPKTTNQKYKNGKILCGALILGSFLTPMSEGKTGVSNWKCDSKTKYCGASIFTKFSGEFFVFFSEPEARVGEDFIQMVHVYANDTPPSWECIRYRYNGILSDSIVISSYYEVKLDEDTTRDDEIIKGLTAFQKGNYKPLYDTCSYQTIKNFTNIYVSAKSPVISVQSPFDKIIITFKIKKYQVLGIQSSFIK